MGLVGYLFICMIGTIVPAIVFALSLTGRNHESQEFQLLLPIGTLAFMMSAFELVLRSEVLQLGESYLQIIPVLLYSLMTTLMMFVIARVTGMRIPLRSAILNLTAFMLLMEFSFAMVIPAIRSWLPVLRKYSNTNDLQYARTFFTVAFIIFTMICAIKIIYMAVLGVIRSRGNRFRVLRAVWILTIALEVAATTVIYVVMDNWQTIAVIIGSNFVLISLYFLCSYTGVYNSVQVAERQIISETSNALLVVDQNKRYTYGNPKFLKYFPEASEFTLLKTKLDDFLVRFEEKEIEVGDSIFSVELIPLHNNKLGVGTLYSLHDITEQKQREKYLERAREEAELEASTKSKFLRQMSHEIRTPLNVIMGVTEISMGKDLPEDVMMDMKKIRHFSRMLLHEVNTLLDIVRMNANQMEIKCEHFYLKSLIFDVSQMTRILIGDKKLDYRVELDPTIPDAYTGYRDVILTILINFLSNAVKYTAEGDIVLRVNLDSERNHGEENQTTIVLSVSDTGRGIKPEDMGKVFTEFERLNGENNAGIVGSGIGLSTVSSLIKMIGGEVDLESEYGKGSVFTAYVPLTIESDTPVGEFSSEYEEYEDMEDLQKGNGPDYIWQDVRMLVIDDMEMNIEIIRELLARHQIELDSALNYREALSLVKEKDYDIIFCDYMMPGMDGIELQQKIREVPGYAEKPILVVSADATRGRREAFLEAGFDEQIAKPVTGAKIEEMLKLFLPQEKHKEMESTPAEEKPFANTKYDATIAPMFYREANKILGEFDTFVAEKDYENLAIKVHGIKGAARSVGMKELGTIAETFEHELKAGDFDRVEERTASFALEVKKALEELESLGLVKTRRQAKDKHAGDVKTDNAWKAKLREAVDAFDYDAAIAVIAETNQAAEAGGDAALIDLLEQITEELEMLEYDAVLALLE